MQYIRFMYFRFCGWRHVFIQLTKYMQFAMWRHRGRSLPSPTAFCGLTRTLNLLQRDRATPRVTWWSCLVFGSTKEPRFKKRLRNWPRPYEGNLSSLSQYLQQSIYVPNMNCLASTIQVRKMVHKISKEVAWPFFAHFASIRLRNQFVYRI